MKKLLSFVLCVVLIGSVAVPAFAVDATVDYCRVKIVVDGATIVPKDADGKPVEPFIWKGTTYLPVRSVANALGLEVGWEPGTVKLTSGGSRTAAIGKPTESHRTRTISMGGQDTKVTLDGKELTLKDAARNPVTPIISGGVTYLPVRAIADAVNVPVLWDGENATVYLGKAIEWRLVKHTYGDRLFITYAYDAQGKLISMVYTDPDTVTTHNYVYNGTVCTGGTCQEVSHGVITNGVETAEFDEKGQLVSYKITWEDGRVSETQYTYDERGNEVTSTQGIYFVRYTYDEFNRIVQEEHQIGGESPYTYTDFHSYNDCNQLITTKTVFDTDSRDMLMTYFYDEYGNLLKSEWNAVDDGKTYIYLDPSDAEPDIFTYEYTPIYK